MGNAVSLSDPEAPGQCPPGLEADSRGRVSCCRRQLAYLLQVAEDKFARLFADDRVEAVGQMPDFKC